MCIALNQGMNTMTAVQIEMEIAFMERRLDRYRVAVARQLRAGRYGRFTDLTLGRCRCEWRIDRLRASLRGAARD